jgi:hypothetical protein
MMGSVCRTGANITDAAAQGPAPRRAPIGAIIDGSESSWNEAMSMSISIREQAAPDFSHSLRGYDREQVDEYVTSLRGYTIQVEDRAGAAESALLRCRRELASAPGTVGISERLASILQLANEEASEIRERARADSEATTRAAASQAERTIDDANAQRDSIQREIDELSEIREELLGRLIALGGQIVEATERYQGYPPGAAPHTRPEVKLFDAEAADDEPADDVPADDEPRGADDPVTDPDAETQRFTPTGQTPEQ